MGKLWNTLGECKYTIEDQGHTEWVSCVRFSPNTATPIIVSAGWDKLVKVWNLTTCTLKTNLVGRRLNHQLFDVLAKQILVVRWYRQRHQNLGLGEQIGGRRPHQSHA